MPLVFPEMMDQVTPKKYIFSLEETRDFGVHLDPKS